MRKLLYLLCALGLLLAAGCGRDHRSPAPVFHTDIPSDPTVDGYVVDGATVFRNSATLFAGIDPVGGVSETRAFLDFPVAEVPADAFIESAFLDLIIDSIQPAASVPILIELVSFPPPLQAEDFSTAPLTATVAVKRIFPNDSQVTVDVTSLLRTAQSLRRQDPNFTDFQFRISQDSGSPVQIGIDDTDQNAPLLLVDYSR